ETDLIKVLLKNGLKKGVIGRTRLERLKYGPSLTYWSAFNNFKIFGNEHKDRARMLDELSTEGRLHLVSDDGDITGGERMSFEPDPRFSMIAKNLFHGDWRDLKWKPD